MSFPSLIGRLAPGSDVYSARPCNRAGDPEIQVPALGKALHRYHDGDVGRLVTAILRHDWESINPWSAGNELDTGRRTPFTAEDIRPHRGIGYRLAESAPHPITGRLSDPPARPYRWLYAFDAPVLRVVHNHDDRRWVPVYDLATADLTAFEATSPGVAGAGPSCAVD